MLSWRRFGRNGSLTFYTNKLRKIDAKNRREKPTRKTAQNAITRRSALRSQPRPGIDFSHRFFASLFRVAFSRRFFASLFRVEVLPLVSPRPYHDHSAR